MNAITIHLAKDMVPICTVQNGGYKQMTKTLDPKYVLPSQKYFSFPFIFKSIMVTYRAKKMKIVSMSHYLWTWLYLDNLKQSLY